MFIRTLVPVAAALLLHVFPPPAHALGVQPETSVLIIQEADGEGKMIVTNTDDGPLLLHTTLRTLPEMPLDLLVVTPPVARIEGGRKQLVRFVIRPHEDLKVQQLQRVVFEGIPEATRNVGTMEMNVRQDLPVIINPRGLKLSEAPWKLLEWRRNGSSINVLNPSPHVVRLSQKIELRPGNSVIELPRPYILPGERLALFAGAAGLSVDTVRFSPASLFGYSVDAFEAPVGQR